MLKEATSFTGVPYSYDILTKMRFTRMDLPNLRIITQGGGKLTPEMWEVYKTVGGTPHLDGQYTVFGEVVSGLDVVDAIQQVATDDNDRPLEDVRIVRAYLKSR